MWCLKLVTHAMTLHSEVACFCYWVNWNDFFVRFLRLLNGSVECKQFIWCFLIYVCKWYALLFFCSSIVKKMRKSCLIYWNNNTLSEEVSTWQNLCQKSHKLRPNRNICYFLINPVWFCQIHNLIYRLWTSRCFDCRLTVLWNKHFSKSVYFLVDL